MNNNKPKSKRGGKRPGAGAKPLPPSEKRTGAYFKFHPSTIAALNKLPEGTRARFAESAIRLALDLPPLPGMDYMQLKAES
jgi:hypothetical protein